MQNNAVTTIDDTPNLARAGATARPEAPREPLATPGHAAAGVVASTSANAEPVPTVAPADPSNIPASDVLLPITTTASIASPAVGKPIQWIKGGAELARTSRTQFTSWTPEVAVEAGHESTLQAILQRAEWVCLPLCGTPLPNGWDHYGTTEQFFTRIRETIVEQALLSEQASSLLAYWSLSTWFPDALPLAPCLAIIGSPEEGDRVLRVLSNLCRFPLRMMGINIPDLRTIRRDIPPTLLFYEPNLTKQNATFLGCSTRRGYLLGGWNKCRDFYGSKAIYLGEDVPVGPKLEWSLQVNVTATTTVRMAPALSDSGVLSLQRQLLGYRLTNLIKVENSTFDAQALPADIRPIANALGACLVDSPKLQDELISWLAPQVEQRLADRSSSLKGMTIEAILSLAHQGKSKLLAREIATQVNCISKARGEQLEYKPENIGHTLKMLGLLTQRLGKDGRGLVVDQPTLARVHGLAVVYGGVGLDTEDKNQHCSLCTQNKRVM
jgi:hypothetical protein